MGMVRKRGADESEREPSIPISLASAPALRGVDDPKIAERIRKDRVRVAKERKKLAARGYNATVQDAKLERAEENLRLSEMGMKRQFLTGRIVPVKGSYRSKAHRRRLR